LQSLSGSSHSFFGRLRDEMADAVIEAGLGMLFRGQNNGKLVVRLAE
jgi:hypothetical protein